MRSIESRHLDMFIRGIHILKIKDHVVDGKSAATIVLVIRYVQGDRHALIRLVLDELIKARSRIKLFKEKARGEWAKERKNRDCETHIS